MVPSPRVFLSPKEVPTGHLETVRDMPGKRRPHVLLGNMIKCWKFSVTGRHHHCISFVLGRTSAMGPFFRSNENAIGGFPIQRM